MAEYSFGGGLRFDPGAEFERGRQQARESKINRLLGTAYNDPGQRGSALARIAGLDAGKALQAQEAFQSADEATRKAEQARRLDLGQRGKAVVQAARAGNLPLASALYRPLVRDANQEFGGALPEEFDEGQIEGLETFASIYAPEKTADLRDRYATVNGTIVDLQNDPTKAIYTAPAAPRYFEGDDGIYDVTPEGLRRLPMAGGSPAPSGDDPFASLLASTPGLRVTSGQRTTEQNAAAGGVPNSFHLTGQARDFGRPTPEQRGQIQRWADANGYEVIDNYADGHVHVEPKGRPPQSAGFVPKGTAQRRAQERRQTLADQRADNADRRAQEAADRAAEAARAKGTVGRALTQGTVNELTKDAGRLDNLTGLAATFTDDYAGNVLGGDVENFAGRNLPFGIGATPGQAEWWQQYDRLKNQVRNELFGASLTAGEKAAFEAADINPNLRPEVIRDNLAAQRKIIQGALERKAKTWAAQGYNPEAIRVASGIDVAPRQNAGQNVPTVTSQAQYDALPSGAVFIEDGQQYRKP